MEALSDDDFERVSEIDLSDSESDQERADRETPSSTPPSSRHIRASDRKTIHCTYEGCPKTFNRKARLEEHLRSHTNSRIFKCTYAGCSKDFLRETHLKHHIKSAHSGVRDYKCSWKDCDKSFATGTRLRRHEQAHEGREKYRCRGYGNCNLTFRKHDTLRRHILQVHEQMRPFPCHDLDTSGRQCHQAFDTAEKLRAHQRSKHDKTRFACTECLSFNAQTSDTFGALTNQHLSAYFPTYSELQAHISEYHPPICPYCPTAFTTSKELTRHLELEHDIIDESTSKVDAFACTVPNCGRSFTKKGNLTVHIKTVHENKKDFICGETDIVLPKELQGVDSVEVDGCGRAFTTKASLEDHVRTVHLGMTSLQVERKKKRKAERRDSVHDQSTYEPKTRKPRKDKGVKKTSILQNLTGAHVSSSVELLIDPALVNSFTIPHPSIVQAPDSAHPNVKVESDEDDDWNQLSGSMTLLDDRLYHYDEQFEYASNEYPAGLTPPSSRGRQSPDLQSSTGYNRVDAATTVPLDDEPFFGGFEHEPESMSNELIPTAASGLRMSL